MGVGKTYMGRAYINSLGFRRIGRQIGRFEQGCETSVFRGRLQFSQQALTFHLDIKKPLLTRRKETEYVNVNIR